MPDIAELAAQFRSEYRKLHSWAQVARKYQVTKPLAWRIANKGYEPKKFAIRKILELPLVATVTPILAAIPFGAQALFAQRCACGQHFISNHPLRKKCFRCSPYRKRRRPPAVP